MTQPFRDTHTALYPSYERAECFHRLCKSAIELYTNGATLVPVENLHITTMYFGKDGAPPNQSDVHSPVMVTPPLGFRSQFRIERFELWPGMIPGNDACIVAVLEPNQFYQQFHDHFRAHGNRQVLDFKPHITIMKNIGGLGQCDVDTARSLVEFLNDHPVRSINSKLQIGTSGTGGNIWLHGTPSRVKPTQRLLHGASYCHNAASFISMVNTIKKDTSVQLDVVALKYGSFEQVQACVNLVMMEYLTRYGIFATGHLPDNQIRSVDSGVMGMVEDILIADYSSKGIPTPLSLCVRSHNNIEYGDEPIYLSEIPPGVIWMPRVPE